MEIKLREFTKYDQQINEEIRNQLNEIVKIILNVSKENGINLKSIILGGGFGRGEGSVLIDNNKVVPLKDYDFAIIVDKKPHNGIIDKIKEESYERLKMDNPSTTDFHLSSFLIDTWFTTENILSLIKDIRIYEFKTASFVLWGEDIRPKIPIQKEDIPFSTVLRFLFEKATGLIAHFSQQHLSDDNISNSKKISLCYECYKTYVEICTVLCVLMDCYEPSFEKRMILFQENFEKKMPELNKKLPNLPDLVEKYTNFKLKPSLEFIESDDPIDLWFQTRDDLIKVIKFCLESYTNSKNLSWTNYYDEYCEKMSKKYLVWMGNSLLNKFGIYNNHLANITNPMIQIALNWRYNIVGLINNRSFKLSLILNTKTPIVKVFLIAPLLLLSIQRDGNLNEDYFNYAQLQLSKLVKIKSSNMSWDDARSFYLDSYYLSGDIK